MIIKPHITIGSDPEIAFISPLEETPLEASEYITDGGNKKLFGLDANSSTAEIRPTPDNNPLSHAKKIEKLLFSTAKDKNYQEVFQLELKSSCSSKSIGGHIHIGHKKLKSIRSSSRFIADLINKDGNLSRSEANQLLEDAKQKITNLSDQLVTNFDTLLSFPLMFIENEAHAEQRKLRDSYGKMGDVRGKAYGIEYRTPPCWLANRKLTEATLCLAYTIAHQTVNKDFTTKHDLKAIKGFNDNYKRHYTKLLHPYLKPITAEIKKSLELFPKYKKQINYLLLSASQQKPLLNQEIKLGWSIPFKLLRNIALLSIKELQDKATQALTAPKSTSSSINYMVGNDDYKITEITQNLNRTLSYILNQKRSPSSSSNTTQLYLKGLHQERGERVDINYDPRYINSSKIKRLEKILKALATTLNYPKEINWNITKGGNFYESDGRYAEIKANIGLGYNIRKHDSYLAEAIILTTLLFTSPHLYKSYKVNETTGKKITLPIISKTLLSAVKKNLGDKKKSSSTRLSSDDGGWCGECDELMGVNSDNGCNNCLEYVERDF